MTNEEIAKLKSLMKQGIVKFKFQKKDGTERVAYGTTKPELCPKTVSYDTYDITCIEWDLDDWDSEQASKIREGLPTRCKVKIPSDVPADEIESELSEALTAEYGFCHNGFAYAKLEKQPKKLAPGTIFFADKERGGYRSCNESQLLSFEDELLTEEDIPF